MNIVVILNNHNSFPILDICIQLAKANHARQIDMVCEPQFFTENSKKFQKYDFPLHLIDATGSAYITLVRESPDAALKGPSKALASGSAVAGFWSRSTRLAKKLLRHSSAFQLLKQWHIYRKHGRAAQQAGNLLLAQKTDLILSYSDRSHDYVEGAVLAAARKYGLPVILPYIAQFEIDAAFEYRTDSNGVLKPEFNPHKKRSLYKIWSHALLREQLYKGAFFQEPCLMNAARKRGILSSYPWSVGNGLSSLVCVDSQATKEKFERWRVAPEKIRITGQIQYDEVFYSYQNRSQLKEAIAAEYGFEKQKSLLILSLPQYAEQGYLTWEAHWLKIEEILTQAQLAEQNLLLSLHPKSKLEDYQFLEERFSCQIAKQPLAKIIGAADLFLASNSTTLLWPVLCGISAISFWSPVPFYFGHLKSISLVNEPAELAGAIKQVTSGPPVDFTEDWERLSRDQVFDGNYVTKLAGLLLEGMDSRA